MLLRMIGILLKMPIILSTPDKLLLMRSDSGWQFASCLCYGWATYRPPSKLSSTLLYNPTDHFQKWTGGEATRVSRQICGRYSPKKFHLDFMGILIYQTCMCFSFIYQFLHISVQKGQNTERSKFVLPNSLMSWSSNLSATPRIVCTSQLAA